MSDSFDDRLVTQTITPEQITHLFELDNPDPAIEWAAKRLERNYNCVTVVIPPTNSTSAYKTVLSESYTIKAIAARDADVDTIRRGMESVAYWLDKEWEDTNE